MNANRIKVSLTQFADLEMELVADMKEPTLAKSVHFGVIVAPSGQFPLSALIGLIGFYWFVERVFF